MIAPPIDPERMTTAPEEHRASPGDRLVIHGHQLGEPERDAEILEVLGSGGSPPFKVRWTDTGAVSEVFPGSDAVVQHFAHDANPRSKRS